VTEIPEHLLRRSKERRAALSGEGTATEEAAAVTAETPRAAAPVRASAPPATQAAGGAPPGRTPAPGPGPASPPPRFRPTRTKTPLWVMPVLVLLPLWGIVYLGAFGSRAKVASNSPVTVGAGIYTSIGCAGCHGANGEGGVGPQLNNGAVLKQWPNLQDHINWVHTGGATHIGQTIGGVVVTASNAMPAFNGVLKDTEIADVVCYERVTFGGAAANTSNCPATS
jgi:mono/diheme cytochrome c family protein